MPVRRIKGQEGATMFAEQNPIVISVDFRNARKGISSPAAGFPDVSGPEFSGLDVSGLEVSGLETGRPAAGNPGAGVGTGDLVALAGRLEAEMQAVNEALETLNKALSMIDPQRLFRSARQLAELAAEAHLPAAS